MNRREFIAGAGAAIVLCAAACYAVTLPLRAKVR